MTRKFRKLTNTEIAALRAFADAHGRGWRNKLNHGYWYHAAKWRGPNGDDEQMGATLHGLRNSHGPTWLARFKLPPLLTPEAEALGAALADTAPTSEEAGSLSIPPDQWLAELFQFEYCAECGGDAEHHDAIPFNDKWFAKCKYPMVSDTEVHPVIAAWREAGFPEATPSPRLSAPATS